LFCPYKMYDVGNANKSNLASGWLRIQYLNSVKMAVLKNLWTKIIYFLKACERKY
jgi:hypothetical protein